MSAAAATGGTFPGARVTPDDPRYATLVRGFNLRWVGRPRYVELCGDTDQVVRAVQEAVDAGLRITVRGGGHCYEDFVSGNDGGVILDLSAMNGVYLDAATGCHVIEGGATLWDAYVQMYREYGVTIPGGSCASVGAGGHVCGGGYGLLSRRHGLTVDHLHGVEIVCVDTSGVARAITATRDSVDDAERLLLWANLGGGGGQLRDRHALSLPRPARRSERGVRPQPRLALERRRLPGSSPSSSRTTEGSSPSNSGVGSPFSGLFSLLHLTQRAGNCPQIVLTAQYVGDEPQLLDTFASEVERRDPAAGGAGRAGRLPWRRRGARPGGPSAAVAIRDPDPQRHRAEPARQVQVGLHDRAVPGATRSKRCGCF